VLVIAGVVTASEIGSQSSPHAKAGPSSRPHTAITGASTVEVSSKALIGLPVSLVVRQLNQQGLRVHVLWSASSAQAPGTVLAVWPTGRRPSGSLVTVTGATRPPGAGNGHGNGDGNGNGQGND